ASGAEGAGGPGGAGYAPGDTFHEARPTWRNALPRWLATLNPGRTRIEYERALRYFFETPGVPPALSDLTFDLLLAYPGALALRATPRAQGAGDHATSRQSAARDTCDTQLRAASPWALPGHAASDGQPTDGPHQTASM